MNGWRSAFSRLLHIGCVGVREDAVGAWLDEAMLCVWLR